MPLWQLRWGAQAAPALLAARAPYAAAVFAAAADADPARGARGRPGEQASGRLGRGRAGPAGPGEPPDPDPGGPARWALAPAAALRTRRRLAHLAWNRMRHSELALVCEGGALHVADVAAAGGGPLALGFKGTPFPAALVAQRVGAPAGGGGGGGGGATRACCCPPAVRTRDGLLGLLRPAPACAMPAQSLPLASECPAPGDLLAGH